MQYLLIKVSLALLLLAVVSEAPPAPFVPSETNLDNTFADPAVVENVVLCFEGKKKCSTEEEKMKVRADATMKNAGKCPSSLCSPQEIEQIKSSMVRADATMKNAGKCPSSICSPQEVKQMKSSMGVLIKKHPDLFKRMVAAMADVPEIGPPTSMLRVGLFG